MAKKHQEGDRIYVGDLKDVVLAMKRQAEVRRAFYLAKLDVDRSDFELYQTVEKHYPELKMWGYGVNGVGMFIHLDRDESDNDEHTLKDRKWLDEQEEEYVAWEEGWNDFMSYLDRQIQSIEEKE